MGKGSVAVIGVALLCVVVPAIALSIASFVIAADNKDTTCDGSMMPLPTWLNVYGGVSLSMVILLIVSLVMLFMEHASAMIGYIVLTILYQLFTLAWNVTGAVALFRDSMDCKEEAKSLWVMTLIVLIFQWLGFIQACCTRRSDD